jgi:periplasmic copper chaperone A
MKELIRVAMIAIFTIVATTISAMGDHHEIKLGNLIIGKPWSRQSPMAADVAAGFLTIQNTGGEDDKLLKATAEITPKVQLHDMEMVNDVMKMVELPAGIPIPAGQTVELKPKSLHVMFMDLKTQVQQGTVFKGTLVFEKAGTVEVEFEVRAPNAGM